MPRLLVATGLALLSALPATAQDLVNREVGGELGYIDFDGQPQTSFSVFGTTDLHYTDHFGFQGSIGAQHLGTSQERENSVWLDVNPYVYFDFGLAAGLYAQGWASDHDPASAFGGELAWKGDAGLEAQIYYGNTWGDGVDDGYITSKGLQLGYTFAGDIYGTLYGYKDTINQSGQTDRDYYDYGIGVEYPLGYDGMTRLTGSFGQIRLDAEGETDLQVSVGLTRQFGGLADRPTFSLQRSVVTGLVNY
ncbi:hypothetical protein [Tropicimonas sp. IMCC34043]|uniref:hypothetical protein n=1 Tax=Tropicimonas sp. IMCC34043 TaxID=2248760 RepID=UPI000E28493E|nr:hypothetical protein [Tropicimonas sp. IMCC34043]